MNDFNDKINEEENKVGEGVENMDSENNTTDNVSSENNDNITANDGDNSAETENASNDVTVESANESDTSNVTSTEVKTSSADSAESSNETSTENETNDAVEETATTETETSTENSSENDAEKTSTENSTEDKTDNSDNSAAEKNSNETSDENLPEEEMELNLQNEQSLEEEDDDEFNLDSEDFQDIDLMDLDDNDEEDSASDSDDSSIDGDGNAMWYTLHIFSGKENEVKDKILELQNDKEIGNCIEDVFIPTEVVLTKPTKKSGEKKVRKASYPGYIFIKAKINNTSWYRIRNIEFVVGFAGQGSNPIPLTPEEIRRLDIEKVEINFNFQVGDEIKIIRGSFETFTGKITEVMDDKEKVKARVLMFGRETELELAYDDIDKI